MKLIIDIDEKIYRAVIEDNNMEIVGDNTIELGRAIVNGTPYEERPKGEWVFIDILEDDNFPMDKGSDIYECSVCGRRIWTFSEDLTSFYPFCHCGADMRKGGAE